MFRYTIREIFLLVLIVALGVGWWLDHQRLTGEIANGKWWRQAAAAAEEAFWTEGWKVEWNRDRNAFHASNPTSIIEIQIGDREPGDPIQSWSGEGGTNFEPLIHRHTGQRKFSK